MTKTVKPATAMEAVTIHIPDVVIGTTDDVDGDDVPFAIGDIATLASQPYFPYDDRCASLETQCGDVAGVSEPTFLRYILGTLTTIGVTGVRVYRMRNYHFL